jgi:1-deoxy-D-xylulose-5-phosphate synthase
MILDSINTTADLKGKSIDELNVLAGEIRSLILEVVSKNGGHLASSLGAVELCIALHACLDTPRDSLVFDVGHQTYAHKILTGRRDSFRDLRREGGISGFPNPEESDYDLYLTGHASTAVSYAQGIAESKKCRGDTSHTVAVVGDGSLSGGMCFEALNHCGHSQSEVLVIVNHNEMSISPSVGALSSYLTKFVSAPVYNRIKNELEQFMEHFSFTKKLSMRARRFEEAVKGLIVPGIFFEELGFRYFGPIDGHDLGSLIPTLHNIASLKGPRLLHVITKKGKGYRASEDNPEEFHGSVPFEIETGAPLAPTRETFGSVFAKKLIERAEKDDRIMAITAAMPKGTGLHHFAEKFPDRLHDVGIAEEHAVGFASGLARDGQKPVVAIYSTFLQRSFDQIIHDVALQNLPVVFMLDRAGVVGEDGPTHHGVFDVGYLRLIPNLVCMAPKDREEMEDMLDFALDLGSPVSLRYPKGAVYSLNARTPITPGRAEVLREGRDVCLVALGSMVRTAMEAVSLLEESGIDAGLVNARFIKPIDENLLEKLAKRYPLLVTVEEGVLAGGFGSAVMEFYEGRNMLDRVRLLRAGFPDRFLPLAGRDAILERYGLDPHSLAERVRRALSRPDTPPPKEDAASSCSTLRS